MAIVPAVDKTIPEVVTQSNADWMQQQQRWPGGHPIRLEGGSWQVEAVDGAITNWFALHRQQTFINQTIKCVLQFSGVIFSQSWGEHGGGDVSTITVVKGPKHVSQDTALLSSALALGPPLAVSSPRTTHAQSSGARAPV